MSGAQSMRDTLRHFLHAGSDTALAGSMLRAGQAHMPHYRDSSIAARADALQTAFPTVLLLLGEAAFPAMATGFAQATPARHWDLNGYGAELPAWIRSQQPDGDGALLADVAQLDWAMHRAAFAADHPPLDRSALAAVDAPLQAQLRFTPHPATALVASTLPMASLWRSARDETFAMPAPRAETALVGRDQHDRVWMRRVSSGEAAFVAAMLGGAPLAQSLATARLAQAGFDLPAQLQVQLADQVWSGFD